MFCASRYIKMVKSKTFISKQEAKKTNPDLVETIREAKNKKGWISVASVMAGPRSNWKSMNIGQIDSFSKEGEGVLILGKVLSQGEIDKKVRVVAFGFSEVAREKLKIKGCETLTIMEEIKKNPECKGLRVLR